MEFLLTEHVLLTKQRQELLLQCLQGELARTYNSVVIRVASVDIVGLLTNWSQQKAEGHEKNAWEVSLVTSVGPRMLFQASPSLHMYLKSVE